MHTRNAPDRSGMTLGIGDYVSKLHILAQHAHANPRELALRKNLPQSALACLNLANDCIADPTQSNPLHA